MSNRYGLEYINRKWCVVDYSMTQDPLAFECEADAVLFLTKYNTRSHYYRELAELTTQLVKAHMDYNFPEQERIKEEIQKLLQEEVTA